MALKRLDEEFELKPGTQLLPYMKRLLPSLEGRFQSLESERKTYDMAVEDMRAIALKRINEILIPATEAITEVTTLGFLLGPSTSSVKLELGNKIFVITEGPQRDTFTPSPYVIVERTVNIDDYAIARVEYYEQDTGVLSLNITAVHGNPGPWNDWVISSTPGMADSTKLYHDAIGPLHDQVVVDAAQVAADKIAVENAANALFAAGLDAQSFIRKDGAVPFQHTQIGVAPGTGANDANLVTARWTRDRIIEYAGNAVSKLGDTISGPLYLTAAITQPKQAATKEYVDATESGGHWVNDYLGVRGVSPALLLQSTGTQQNRYIQSNSSSGVLRWQLFLADAALESGGNAGSDFVLHRYTDLGAYLGPGLHISRQTAVMTIYNRLDATGGLNVTAGGGTIVGDMWSYRAGTNTGVLFMGNARTAYHYWDGGTHQFTAGGISCGGSPLTGGHLNCYSIYTQGYGVTCWGLTSHGTTTSNGVLNINAAGNQITLSGTNYNQIQFYDTDWGPMYLHHNQDLIGFLNNGNGWCFWATNAGHVWSAQYGWFHDYVNNTAYNYAWDAANYRYNQLVSANRWAYCGDLPTSWNNGNLGEPYGGAAVTGFAGYNGYNIYLVYLRFRQLQYCVAGGWYAAWYA
jgi:hypothetical protein